MTAKIVKLSSFTGVLEARIAKLLKDSAVGGQRIKEALNRIGMMVETEAKINIRNKRIINTGALLNSIRYELFTEGKQAGVKIGSFGIPYAAVHEFGFEGHVSVKSFTRNQSRVSAHTRFMHIRARPYLKPALKKRQQDIMFLMKNMILGDRS